MRLKQMWLASALVLVCLPLVGAVYAADCCHGTTCENVQGCTKNCDAPYDQTCKRTCTPQCTEGNGCCEFQYQNCEYSGSGCSAAPCTQIVNVNFSSTKECKQGPVEVPCLGTASGVCE